MNTTLEGFYTPSWTDLFSVSALGAYSNNYVNPTYATNALEAHVRVLLDWARRTGVVEVCRHEGHAEHEEAHGGHDEAGADVLAGEIAVHGSVRILELDVGDHSAEEQGQIGE